MDWLNKVPKKNENIAWRIIDGEIVLIPLEESSSVKKINVFNETATRIWELIEGHNSIAGIIKKLVNDYDVDYTEAELRVKEFVDNLSKKNLIFF